MWLLFCCYTHSSNYSAVVAIAAVEDNHHITSTMVDNDLMITCDVIVVFNCNCNIINVDDVVTCTWIELMWRTHSVSLSNQPKDIRVQRQDIFQDGWMHAGCSGWLWYRACLTEPCLIHSMSLSSCGLSSALLVLSAVYLFRKVSFSPDIIPSGWLGSEHQLTN